MNEVIEHLYDRIKQTNDNDEKARLVGALSNLISAVARVNKGKCEENEEPTVTIELDTEAIYKNIVENMGRYIKVTY